MGGITVNDFSMRTAHATKNPVAHLEARYLAAHLFDTPGDLHAHDKGQLLTAVVPRAHPGLRKVDAARADAHADGIRRQFTKIQGLPDHHLRSAEFLYPISASHSSEPPPC